MPERWAPDDLRPARQARLLLRWVVVAIVVALIAVTYYFFFAAPTVD